jgi:hypothetical protein
VADKPNEQAVDRIVILIDEDYFYCHSQFDAQGRQLSVRYRSITTC